LILSIGFFGLGLVLLTLLLLARTKRASVFSPMGFFSIMFGVVYFVVPILCIATEVWQADSPVRDALFLALAYYFMVVMAFLISRPVGEFKTILRSAAMRIGRHERGLVPLLFVVQLASAVYTIRMVLPYIGGNYAQFMMNRIAISEGKGYLMEPVLFGMAVALLVTAPLLVGKKRGAGFLWLAGLCSIAITSLVGVLVGSRLNIVIGIVYLVVSAAILSATSGKARRIVFIFIALLTGVALLGVIRSSIARGGLEKGNIVGQIQSGGMAAIARDLSVDFSQLESLAIVQAKESDWTFAYGRTYAAVFFLPVPRALWHEKPAGAGPMLANIIKPGTYDINKKYRSSTTPGCVTEAYLNGGVFGVLIIAVIHGYLIASLTRFGARVRFRDEYVIYVFLMFLLGETLVYNEFGGSLERIGVCTLPILLYGRVRKMLGVRSAFPIQLTMIQRVDARHAPLCQRLSSRSRSLPYTPG
jgi:uncharacterized membrane protein